MTTPPAALALLADPKTARVMAALDGQGEEARIVGGALRNALMGLPVADVRAEVRKQSQTKTVLVAMDRKPTRAVVVERRVIRKPAAERRSYSA